MVTHLVMRRTLTTLVALLGLALSTPALAGPKDKPAKAKPSKERAKKAQPAKAKPAKAQPAKAKPAKESAKKAQPAKAKPAKETAKAKLANEDKPAKASPATSCDKPKTKGTPAPEQHSADAEHDELNGEHAHGDEAEDGPSCGVSPKSAVLDLSDAELDRRVRDKLASLGPMSVGHPNSGLLVNPVQMPKSDRWVLMEPGVAWGTQETVDYLAAAINAVHARHPGSHKLYIGHISAKRGGHLSPHKSHQTGRDVDISFFYKDATKLTWYRRVNADNLDRARTWTFVRALLTETDAQYIFINTSVQKLLKEHALAIGEDPDWLDSVFQYQGKPGTVSIIRHAPGHDTHIHVRFYNPVAQELGRRAYPLLVTHKIIKPALRYIQHTVKKGDILGRLATRYKTTVAAIKQLNKMRDNKILAGHTLLIPKKETAGQVRRVAQVVVPPRRLPPDTGGTRGGKAAPAESR